jgi:hypothetical protein
MPRQKSAKPHNRSEPKAFQGYSVWYGFSGFQREWKRFYNPNAPLGVHYLGEAHDACVTQGLSIAIFIMYMLCKMEQYSNIIEALLYQYIEKIWIEKFSDA